MQGGADTGAGGSPSGSAPGPRLSLIFGDAGRPLTREDVLSSQRGRLLEGIANAVAAKGYAATTVADVVALAATSRRTFYEHFADKEDCFLAAYDAAIDVILSQMAAASASGGDWHETCRAALRAYLGLLAEEPPFARAFIVEVTAAGEAARDRRTRVHDRFVDFLEALHAVARRQDPSLGPLSRTVFEALVGGINELVWREVDAGNPERLPGLEDGIMHLVLALYLGAAPAERDEARTAGDADAGRAAR